MTKLEILRNCLRFCTKLYKLPIPPRSSYGLIQHRAFSLCSVLSHKIFQDYENNFAHNVLQNKEVYRVLRGEQNVETSSEIKELNLNQNWKELPSEDLLMHLQLIGRHCNHNGLLISDERFDDFIDAYTVGCVSFTDDQLIRSLQILMNYPETETPKTRNFAKLWNSLDSVCTARIPQWGLDKILYVCDHWFALDLGRICKFNLKSNYKIGRKVRTMQPHHLVQTMFYCNLLRSPVVEMREVEFNMLHSLDKLSINEIAILCIAFFKTETKIHDADLISNIYNRVMREIEEVDNIPFVNILKILKYSSKLDHINTMKQLLDIVGNELPRLNLLSCLYVALLGTQIQVCNQENLEFIVQRFVVELETARLKDLERICFVMGLFDFESESRIEDELCNKIIDQLKCRTDEISKHPKCLPLCLHYLTMKGFADMELLSTALSPQFLTFTYGSEINVGRQIFALDAYAQINLKYNYNGHLLSEISRGFMGKTASTFIPHRNSRLKHSTTDKLLLEMKEATEELFKYSYLAHVLPHYDRPDLIVALNRNTGAAIDIGRNINQNYSGKCIDREMLTQGLNISSANVEIINLIVGGQNNYVRFSNKLNGLFKLKVEQSEMLGLRPIMIPFFDWKRLVEYERKIYIKLRIDNALRKPYLV